MPLAGKILVLSQAFVTDLRFQRLRVGNYSLWLNYVLFHTHFCSVTEKAWDAKYAGDAHKLLIQALDIMNTNRARRVYDNFVPIIQSSGTGKSRMVNETAKYIFTLLFNLRPSRDASGTIRHSLLSIPSD